MHKDRQQYLGQGITRRQFISLVGGGLAGIGLLATSFLRDQSPASAKAEATLNPEQQDIWNRLIGKHITRYRARKIFDLASHKIDSYQDRPNKDIDIAHLQNVQKAVLADIDKITDGVSKGAFTILDIGNFGDIFLSGGDRLGLDTSKFKESLNTQQALLGKLGADNHLYWNINGGDKTFAFATLYDPTKKGEQQILTAITSAGRARQVFTAMATSVAAARGGEVLGYRNQIEQKLGYTSLNGESGSEFSISCFRTFPKMNDPKVSNINSQPAWYLERDSEIQKANYPSAKIAIGNAFEVDLKDDGIGRMLLSSDEAVLLVIRVDADGQIKSLATGLSDNLVDYDTVRDLEHAAGSEWRPCGVAAPAKAKPTSTKAPENQAQGGGQPNQPEKPTSPPSFPSPMPTNFDAPMPTNNKPAPTGAPTNYLPN